MPRFSLLVLLVMGFIFSIITPISASAQGYPYTGTVVGHFPDCNHSRVVGVVLDEQGNPVTEPVVLRLWREGETQYRRIDSGTHVSYLTGPSGFNFNVQDTIALQWGSYKREVFGTFYVAVAANDISGQKIDEGLLSEPVKVSTEPGCGPESKNVVKVEFRLGGTPATTNPSSPSTPAPSGTSGTVVPVAANATCRAFTETAGGNGQFRVCDDGQANFLTALNRYGVQNIGYPISQRYQKDGFITQAFQKAILQWRPDSRNVAFVNIFDDLHTGGYDQRLKEVRQVPNQLPEGWDGGITFAETVVKRQELLDARPALRTAYFAASDPITFFGLPTSEVTDMGNHYAIRLQRVVLQEWKENVPWARAGQVTIANGGDIAKELGNLPAAALAPEPLP
jgi:hypothetical protein